MIGNDIVDLAQARQESNWRRKGFLSKLFTDYEQELIRMAHDPDKMVWTLWSMKESVYKRVVRETERRFFAPLQFVCQLDTPLSATTQGSVFYQQIYRTMSSITDQYVTSIASDTTAIPFNSRVIHFGQADYQHQHWAIREAVKRHVAACWSVSESHIQIQKDAVDVPTLVINRPYKALEYKPISLSHHGQYGAFVL